MTSGESATHWHHQDRLSDAIPCSESKVKDQINCRLKLTSYTDREVDERTFDGNITSNKLPGRVNTSSKLVKSVKLILKILNFPSLLSSKHYVDLEKLTHDTLLSSQEIYTTYEYNDLQITGIICLLAS